eukprot:177875-Chlamydomonas_euryale.AAC.1
MAGWLLTDGWLGEEGGREEEEGRGRGCERVRGRKDPLRGRCVRREKSPRLLSDSIFIRDRCSVPGGDKLTIRFRKVGSNGSAHS